jgi:hypothetical protein
MLPLESLPSPPFTVTIRHSLANTAPNWTVFETFVDPSVAWDKKSSPWTKGGYEQLLGVGWLTLWAWMRREGGNDVTDVAELVLKEAMRMKAKKSMELERRSRVL